MMKPRMLSAMLIALVVLAGCGATTGRSNGTHGEANIAFQDMAQVVFAPGATYAAALRLITGLGLQPIAWCNAGIRPANAATAPNRWVANGDEALFQSSHGVFVRAYLAAPPDWHSRLEHAPLVADVLPFPTAFIPTCAPANAGDPLPLPVGDVTFARVTFAPAVSYDRALATVSDLGLRLSDPCYEALATQQAPPTWRSMDQASVFAQDAALIVATMPGITLYHWQAALTATPGGVAIASAGCHN